MLAAVALLLVRAPDPAPVPFSTRGSAPIVWPLRSRTPPLLTVVPPAVLPRALALPAIRVAPLLMVVAPPYDPPDKVTVPVATATAPVPLIELVTVVASVRLNDSVALSVTVPVPSVPVVPALPIWRAPAEIVVAP